MDRQIENKRGTNDQKQQEQPPPSSTLYSPSSSPSHEFSFTISFNPSSNINNTSVPLAADKSKPPPLSSSSAMDLSPADDIFFHGHLLPLHLLSHLPTSPRNSIDIFTLPISDLPQDNHTSNYNNSNKKEFEEDNKCNGNDVLEDGPRIQIRPKAKSFSLFGRSKWRKENENGEKEREKKKPRFDVSHMLKRYMKMVKPLLSMKSKRENGEFHKQSHSYSGNVSLRHDDGFDTRRREFSAPASMWTSPSNSGILVPKKGNNLSSPSASSTIEELQDAIQAAIAHCKNSIATDDKNSNAMSN